MDLPIEIKILRRGVCVSYVKIIKLAKLICWILFQFHYLFLYTIKELPGSKKHNSSNLFLCPHFLILPKKINSSFFYPLEVSFYWNNLAFYSGKEYVCFKKTPNPNCQKRRDTTNASLLINFSSINFISFSDLSQDRKIRDQYNFYPLLPLNTTNLFNLNNKKKE